MRDRCSLIVGKGRVLARLFSAALPLVLCSCSSSESPSDPPDAAPYDAGTEEAPRVDSSLDSPTDSVTEATGVSDASDALPEVNQPSSICTGLGLQSIPFSAGPYGVLRHDLADDIRFVAADGSSWSMKETWSGCESHVFIPDSLVVSETDTASVWDKDVDKLLAQSPRNVHYIFFSRKASDENALASTSAMQTRIESALAGLSSEDAAWWKARIHVMKARATQSTNWPHNLMSGIGRIGFAVDRFQRIRGLGSLSDVDLFDEALSTAKKWPFKSSLTYVAYEVERFNYEAERELKLAAQPAPTVVQIFQGETLEQYTDKELTLPSASEMSKFDSLEVDVDMRCPKDDAPEPGNCGAWDYLAHLWVKGEDGSSWIELARLITTYHREGRWVFDVSPMLVHLASGGTKTIRWEHAPEWNKQPTKTFLSLRLSNKKKGYRPTHATFLWSGGDFNASYNAGKIAKTVQIPASAKRVELFTVITGHGAGAMNCSEFCNHGHEFSVNGTAFLRDHPLAATDKGCLQQINTGTVPNQWGTWWFGRAGWCPGRHVDPWIVDISSVASPGSTIAVSYRGLLLGKDPTEDSGNIEMVSYVIAYE